MKVVLVHVEDVRTCYFTNIFALVCRKNYSVFTPSSHLSPFDTSIYTPLLMRAKVKIARG